MKSLKHGIGVAVAVAAVAAAGILSGCATPINSADLSRISTIGIVCFSDDTLSLVHVHIGATISTESTDSVDISDWHVDAAIIEEATNALAGRFALVAYDPVDRDNGLSLGEGVRRSVGMHAGESVVDAYVVIWPVSNVRASQILPRGIGVLELTNAFLPSSTEVYANYAIEVLDGRTFASLASARFRSSTESYRNFVSVDGRDLFAATSSRLSANQKQQINDIIMKELLKDEIPATLRRLRLIP